MRNKALVVNLPFVCSLLLLILNDHYFKWHYHNWFTGKLSDFAGLLMLPLLIAYIFPCVSRWSVYLAAAVFVFWKSNLSSAFIEIYNHIAIIPVIRTIDYTDLLALAILPYAEYLRLNAKSWSQPRFRVTHPLFLIIPSCIAFMATSPPRSYYRMPRGDIYIGETVKLKMSPEQVLTALRDDGFLVESDRVLLGDSRHSRVLHFKPYVIRNIIVSPYDTIKEVHFQLHEFDNKTNVYINSVTVSNISGLNHWKVLRWYSKHYRKYLNRYLRKSLNN